MEEFAKARFCSGWRKKIGCAAEVGEISVGDRSPMDVFHHPYASLGEAWAA